MNNAEHRDLGLDSAEIDEHQLENIRGGVFAQNYGTEVRSYSFEHLTTLLHPNPTYAERLNFQFAVQHGFPVTLRVY